MDPFKDMDDFFKKMMAMPMMGDGASFSSSSIGRWMPPMDFLEKDSTFIVQMDLPGVKKEDLDVNLTNNRLCISGNRVTDGEDDTSKSLRFMLERRGGKFERCLQLPSQVKEESVEADLHEGVLKVVLQKVGNLKTGRSSINVK